jgi:predicted ATP-grasp superfamily ATP-dependent carboligase
LAKILILDGHSAAALAVMRSAGRAGHWVAAGANQGIFAAAKFSKYCKATLDYPVATDNALAFLESVREFVRAQKIDLVLPITDWTLGPLSDAREQFRDLCKVAVPPVEAVRIASDKYETIRLAQSLGVAMPRTWLLSSVGELGQLPELKFPIVVKDRCSVRWSNGRAVFGSVAYAYSGEELEKRVRERLAAAGDVMIQEFAAGAGLGFACFVAKGEVYLPFQWLRIREVDPRGSASSCRKAIPLDAALVAASSKLIAGIGFEGIAMVEYKQPKLGPPVLMEINGRPWGSIALPIASGIDYPRYLIEWWLEGKLPPQAIPFREGVVCRRAVSELTHLTNVRAGKPANWPGDYPSFWPTFFSVAVPWYPGMHYDELWLSDLRPGAEELRNWARKRMKG